MTYKPNSCCSILLRLKLKYLLLITVFVIFHFSIYLFLRFCLNFAFDGKRDKVNRGNVIYSDMDWHDYTYLINEANRTGLGEHGAPAYMPDSADDNETARQMTKYGFNGHLSDLIALNRSVADIRPAECRSMKYSTTLPSVSIIIIFNNEHLKSLIRTCISIFNRSPVKLINEIILVDDASDFTDLGKPLDEFVKDNEPKLKMIRLANRTGLIRARLIGAKQAKSDVLLFLDAHCEVNTNWLPPLLDPIAKNYRRVMCPTIDHIKLQTLEYTAQDGGARGAFDWRFDYKRLPRLPADLEEPAKPFINPIMAGGLFAISTKFFWEIGGYDKELEIWGGEQYELSFKIWMCGGEMYDAPCSRVGHIFRYSTPHPDTGRDHLHRNYKRVAEVWMDEYKHYIYEQFPKTYAEINAGNLSEVRAIRQKLKCKSFDWFIHKIAFDLIRDYPPRGTFDYAWGVVQSQSEPKLCVDSKSRQQQQQLHLTRCSRNLTRPQEPHKFFDFTWRNAIRVHMGENCWDVSDGGKNAPVLLYKCHLSGGNQLWHLDPVKQWIIHGSNYKRCLEFDDKTLTLVVNECDAKNTKMRWSFGAMNKTALASLTP